MSVQDITPAHHAAFQLVEVRAASSRVIPSGTGKNQPPYISRIHFDALKSSPTPLQGGRACSSRAPTHCVSGEPFLLGLAITAGGQLPFPASKSEQIDRHQSIQRGGGRTYSYCLGFVCAAASTARMTLSRLPPQMAWTSASV